MKIVSGLFSLTLLLLSVNFVFGQNGYTATGISPCNQDVPEKKFQVGEVVYVKSSSGGFKKKIYGGYKTKRDPWGNLLTHYIHEPGQPNYVWNLPAGERINDWVLSESEYNQLDPSKGACAFCCPEEYAAIFKAELFKMINDYRRENGAEPLQFDPVLDKAAQQYADYAADHPEAALANGHQADGRTPHDRILEEAKQFGYTIKQNGGKDHAFAGPTGENAVTFGIFCAEDAFNRWKSSPSHDWQMKHDGHVYIGIGVACGVRPRGGTFLFAVNKFAAERWPEDLKKEITAGTNVPTSYSTEDCLAKSSKRIYQTSMSPGNKLYEGQHLISGNGRYQLRVTAAGDLVIEEILNRDACRFKRIWKAPAAGPINNPPPVSYFSFNRDCNFCFESKANKGWCATTGRDANRVIIYQCQKAVLTDDGRLALLDRTGKEMWDSTTGLITKASKEAGCEACNSEKKYQTQIEPGDRLEEGQHLASANGRYQLRVTRSGDMVIEEVVNRNNQEFRQVWKAPAGGPINNPPATSYFSFNKDCNLCFVSKSNKLWCMTDGRDKNRVLLYRCERAVLTDEGILVLLDRKGRQLWSSPR